MVHRQTQNIVVKGGSGKEGNKEGEGYEPRNFSLAFLTKAGHMYCPVEGNSGWAAMRAAMRVHLWHRHIRDTVVIVEEGNFPHPWCPLCDMLVPWRSLNRMHWCTGKLKKGAERK